VASVIGDIFDLNTLAKIHPFQSTINPERLIKLLNELEQRDILEIMEVQADNTYYRFQFPFFRECIYQRMTYAQRRQIHLLVAEAYQLMP
jgi:predicted ATPase